MEIILVDRRRRQFKLTDDGDALSIHAIDTKTRSFTWRQFPLQTINRYRKMVSSGRVYISELAPYGSGSPRAIRDGWILSKSWQDLNDSEQTKSLERFSSGEIEVWVVPSNCTHKSSHIYIREVRN